jgi:hypothetical protein
MIGLSVGAQPIRDAPPAAIVDYYHDFRGQPLAPDLAYFQGEDGRFFNPGPDGLKITIPKTWRHPGGGIGVQTMFGLAGDFEITLRFADLEVDIPPSGFGVGVGIHMIKMGMIPEKIMIARVARAGDDQIVLTQRKTSVQTSLAREKSGQLRLTRLKGTLHYWWSPGLGKDDFRELDRTEIGTDDMGDIRLAAMTNQKPCDLVVRLVDFRIRQTDLAIEESASPHPPESTHSLLILGCVLLLLFLVAGGFVMYRRATRGRRDVVP